MCFKSYDQQYRMPVQVKGHFHVVCCSAEVLSVWFIFREPLIPAFKDNIFAIHLLLFNIKYKYEQWHIFHSIICHINVTPE